MFVYMKKDPHYRFLSDVRTAQPVVLIKTSRNSMMEKPPVPRWDSSFPVSTVLFNQLVSYTFSEHHREKMKVII